MSTGGTRVSRKDEPVFVYGYRVTYLRDEQGNVIGAIVEGPRLSRPVYLPKSTPVKVKLPENVKKALLKAGFQVS